MNFWLNDDLLSYKLSEKSDCCFKILIFSTDIQKNLCAFIHYSIHSGHTIQACFLLYIKELPPLDQVQGKDEVPSLHVFESSTSADQRTPQQDWAHDFRKKRKLSLHYIDGLNLQVPWACGFLRCPRQLLTLAVPTGLNKEQRIHWNHYETSFTRRYIQF